MFQHNHQCPHCLNFADFVFLHITEYTTPESLERIGMMKDKSVRSGRSSAEFKSDFMAVSRCPNCMMPTAFVFYTDRFSVEHIRNATTGDISIRPFILNNSIEIIRTLPEPPDYSSHPAWPARVQQLMSEIREDNARNRMASRIIASARTALDFITKDLGGDPKKNLYSRIDQLCERGVITKALADWSHDVRAIGNDAVHDMDGEPEDARAIVTFIELLLKLTYEIPARITESRDG